MSRLQDNMLALIQRVDPTMKNDVEITAATLSSWGTNGSDRFTAQRLVDCYNEARKIMANIISNRFDLSMRVDALSGLMTVVTNFQFTSGVATKPSGFINAYNLVRPDGKSLSILSPVLYSITKHLDSYENPIVYEHITTFNAVSSTNVPDAATYTLRYFRLVNWTLADVLQTSPAYVDETFNATFDPILLELAVMVAMEQGTASVNAAASRLLMTAKGE